MREYDERVCKVERGVFTPLVLSSTESFGCQATTFYKCLADLISSKQQKHYSNVISWLNVASQLPSYNLQLCVSGAVVHLTTVRGVRNITLTSSEGLPM